MRGLQRESAELKETRERMESAKSDLLEINAKEEELQLDMSQSRR